MYDETVGKLRDSEGTIFDAPSIAEDVPFTEQEISSALDYLEGKGLVRGGGPQVIGEQRFYRNYNIKHSGINEIEQALRAPGHGTEHFPPPTTLNVYGNVGAVQTGSHATANVTQNFGPDLSSIFPLIEQLKQQTGELSEDDRDEAQVTLHELEGALQAAWQTCTRSGGGYKFWSERDNTYNSVTALTKFLTTSSPPWKPNKDKTGTN